MSKFSKASASRYKASTPPAASTATKAPTKAREGYTAEEAKLFEQTKRVKGNSGIVAKAVERQYKATAKILTMVANGDIDGSDGSVKEDNVGIEAAKILKKSGNKINELKKDLVLQKILKGKYPKKKSSFIADELYGQILINSGYEGFVEEADSSSRLVELRREHIDAKGANITLVTEGYSNLITVKNEAEIIKLGGIEALHDVLKETLRTMGTDEASKSTRTAIEAKIKTLQQKINAADAKLDTLKSNLDRRYDKLVESKREKLKFLRENGIVKKENGIVKGLDEDDPEFDAKAEYRIFDLNQEKRGEWDKIAERFDNRRNKIDADENAIVRLISEKSGSSYSSVEADREKLARIKKELKDKKAALLAKDPEADDLQVTRQIFNQTDAAILDLEFQVHGCSGITNKYSTTTTRDLDKTVKYNVQFQEQIISEMDEKIAQTKTNESKASRSLTESKTKLQAMLTGEDYQALSSDDQAILSAQVMKSQVELGGWSRVKETAEMEIKEAKKKIFLQNREIANVYKDIVDSEISVNAKDSALLKECSRVASNLDFEEKLFKVRLLKFALLRKENKLDLEGIETELSDFINAPLGKDQVQQIRSELCRVEVEDNILSDIEDIRYLVEFRNEYEQFGKASAQEIERNERLLKNKSIKLAQYLDKHSADRDVLIGVLQEDKKEGAEFLFENGSPKTKEQLAAALLDVSLTPDDENLFNDDRYQFLEDSFLKAKEDFERRMDAAKNVDVRALITDPAIAEAKYNLEQSLNKKEQENLGRIESLEAQKEALPLIARKILLKSLFSKMQMEENGARGVEYTETEQQEKEGIEASLGKKAELVDQLNALETEIENLEIATNSDAKSQILLKRVLGKFRNIDEADRNDIQLNEDELEEIKKHINGEGIDFSDFYLGILQDALDTENKARALLESAVAKIEYSNAKALLEIVVNKLEANKTKTLLESAVNKLETKTLLKSVVAKGKAEVFEELTSEEIKEIKKAVGIPEDDEFPINSLEELRVVIEDEDFLAAISEGVFELDSDEKTKVAEALGIDEGALDLENLTDANLQNLTTKSQEPSQELVEDEKQELLNVLGIDESDLDLEKLGAEYLDSLKNTSEWEVKELSGDEQEAIKDHLGIEGEASVTGLTEEGLKYVKEKISQLRIDDLTKVANNEKDIRNNVDRLETEYNQFSTLRNFDIKAFKNKIAAKTNRAEEDSALIDLLVEVFGFEVPNTNEKVSRINFIKSLTEENIKDKVSELAQGLEEWGVAIDGLTQPFDALTHIVDLRSSYIQEQHDNIPQGKDLYRAQIVGGALKRLVDEINVVEESKAIITAQDRFVNGLRVEIPQVGSRAQKANEKENFITQKLEKSQNLTQEERQDLETEQEVLRILLYGRKGIVEKAQGEVKKAQAQGLDNTSDEALEIKEKNFSGIYVQEAEALDKAQSSLRSFVITKKGESLRTTGEVIQDELLEEVDVKQTEKEENGANLARSIRSFGDKHEILLPEIKRATAIEGRSSEFGASATLYFEKVSDAKAFAQRLNSYKERIGGDNGHDVSILKESAVVDRLKDASHPNNGQYSVMIQVNTNKDKSIKGVAEGQALVFNDDLSNPKFLAAIASSKEANLRISELNAKARIESIKTDKDAVFKQTMARTANIFCLGIPVVPMLAAAVGGVTGGIQQGLSHPKLGSAFKIITEPLASISQTMLGVSATGFEQTNIGGRFTKSWAKDLKEFSNKIGKDEENKSSASRGSTSGINDNILANSVRKTFGYEKPPVISNSKYNTVKVLATETAEFVALGTRVPAFALSLVPNAIGGISHAIGDTSMGLAKSGFDYASDKKNNPILRLLSGASLVVTAPVGVVTRSVGIIGRSAGDMLAKPSEYSRPEDSVSENRRAMGVMGTISRKFNEIWDAPRDSIASVFPSASVAEAKIDLASKDNKVLAGMLAASPKVEGEEEKATITADQFKKFFDTRDHAVANLRKLMGSSRYDGKDFKIKIDENDQIFIKSKSFPTLHLTTGSSSKDPIRFDGKEVDPRLAKAVAALVNRTEKFDSDELGKINPRVEFLEEEKTPSKDNAKKFPDKKGFGHGHYSKPAPRGFEPATAKSRAETLNSRFKRDGMDQKESKPATRVETTTANPRAGVQSGEKTFVQYLNEKRSANQGGGGMERGSNGGARPKVQRPKDQTINRQNPLNEEK